MCLLYNKVSCFPHLTKIHSFASSQINWQIAILQDIYSKAQVVKVHIKSFENKNIIFYSFNIKAEMCIFNIRIFKIPNHTTVNILK